MSVFAASLAVVTVITVLPQETVPWPQADAFEASVSASVVETRGDTIVIEYGIHNEASSDQAIDSIEAKQRAAARAVDGGDFGTACNQLGALVNELAALPATKITEEGRALVSLATELAMMPVCN